MHFLFHQNLTDLAVGFKSFNFSSTLAWATGSVASPTTLSAGLTTLLFPASGLAVSSLVLTNSTAGIAAISPSGVETVTVPLSSIVTIEFGFTALTSSTILAFSASD